MAPNGTRDLYRKVAELEGLELRAWMREALHREALRVLEAHGVEMEVPDAHPKPPPPIQKLEP